MTLRHTLYMFALHLFVAGWPGLGLVSRPSYSSSRSPAPRVLCGSLARSSASSCFLRPSSSPCSLFPSLPVYRAVAPLSLSISLSLFLPDSSDEGNALPFLDRVPVLTVALHPSARRFASVSPFSRRFRPSSRKRDPVRRFPLLIQRHRGCAITVSP